MTPNERHPPSNTENTRTRTLTSAHQCKETRFIRVDQLKVPFSLARLVCSVVHGVEVNELDGGTGRPGWCCGVRHLGDGGGVGGVGPAVDTDPSILCLILGETGEGYVHPIQVVECADVGRNGAVASCARSKEQGRNEAHGAEHAVSVARKGET